MSLPKPRPTLFEHLVDRIEALEREHAATREMGFELLKAMSRLDEQLQAIRGQATEELGNFALVMKEIKRRMAFGDPFEEGPTT